MSLFSRYLNDVTEVACLMCSGKVFHARIVEGKNELKYKFVFACICICVSLIHRASGSKASSIFDR